MVFNYPSFFVSLAIMAKESHKTTQSKKRMLEAMIKCLGNVSNAALISKVSRWMHYEWLRKDKKYKKEIEDIVEMALDFVESKLFERINGYEHKDIHFSDYQGMVTETPYMKHYPPDVASMLFYLKTRGKHRGYIEKQEVDHTTGGEKITGWILKPVEKKK